MIEAYIGMIVMWPREWAPEGWQLCDGRLLPIRSNQALFAFIGFRYGGDGKDNFALPNLCGRVPVGVGTPTPAGSGPAVALAQTGGAAQVALTTANLPSHSHALNGTSEPAGGLVPNASMLGDTGSSGTALYYQPDPKASAQQQADFAKTITPMHALSIGSTGSNQAVDVRNPFLGLNFIICVNGIFPTQS